MNRIMQIPTDAKISTRGIPSAINLMLIQPIIHSIHNPLWNLLRSHISINVSENT